MLFNYDLFGVLFGIQCNTPKCTLVVFDIFRVLCKRNLNVS